MPKLLTDASETGSWNTWIGGAGVFTAAGTFGGATVTLQYQGPDGSTAIDMGDDTTLTEAGGGGFVFPPGQIRAEVSGGTPSGLYAQAEQVK